MLKARKRTTRKEIKQDKLVTTYFEAKDWLDKEENKKRIYIGLFIIAAIAIAVYFYINHKGKMNEQSEIKLSSVIELYDAGSYQQAIDGDPSKGITGLKEIVNDYGSTQSGQTAKFYLANCLFNLADFDNALKYYDDYSGNNDIIKSSCYSGIGAIFEAKGDLKKAAEYYEKSTKVNKDIIFNQDNLYYAIRCYSHSGDKDDAKRLFSTLKEQFPKSKYINETKRFESEFSD